MTISTHSADLEAMHLQVQAKEAAHTERVLAHQMALTNKLRALENRCEVLQQAEVEMRQKNEAEREQFEKEKQDVIPLVLHIYSTFVPLNFPCSLVSIGSLA